VAQNEPLINAQNLGFETISPKMIDTVKLAIHCPIMYDVQGNKHRPYNSTLYDILLVNVKQNNSGFILNREHGIYTRGKDSVFQGKANIYNTFEMLILDGSVQCPSHNYNMHFRVFEERVEIEFSLPKFIYGTNVFQLLKHYQRRHDPYEIFVQALKKVFEDIFFNVPVVWGAVELLRWDVCFNQVFKSREQSIKALKYIKLKHQSKGDKLNYEYGLIQLTKTNYLKIYHKGEEFKKHDKQKYKGLFPEQIEAIADKILRYEKKYTRTNISYTYNTKFKTNGHADFQEYKRQKKAGKISRYLRNEFESVQRFTLGNSKIEGCTKMPPHFFDYCYYSFKDEIEKKFNIGKSSVDQLHRTVIANPSDAAVRVKILAYIKTFGSLKRAYELGAFSRATYTRYKNQLESKGLSETKVHIKIEQDWSNMTYHRELFKYGIPISSITKSMIY